MESLGGNSLEQSHRPKVGKFRGDLITEVPADLYIPPDALEVVLEAFQGPLDLLLYVIRKHNIDVLDIPMADLTSQYMRYVDAMRINQLELAAEYLLMSALLIEIKSRMLLPRFDKPAENEIDPRAELVRRLVEYEKIKKGAEVLRALPREGRDFSVVSVWADSVIEETKPEVNAEQLRLAWYEIIARAKSSQPISIEREELSVRDQMTFILRKLSKTRRQVFSDFFRGRASPQLLVVIFLAILELGKERVIKLTQSGAMSPIYIELRDE